jgi:hypothetical protein
MPSINILNWLLFIIVEAFFRKWKKSWIVICSGGPVRVFKNKQASRPQKSYNLKLDCIVIKTGRQVKSH